MSENNKISANWIYLVIIVLLIGVGIYFMLTKNMSDEENSELTQQVEQISTDKNEIEQDYNAALIRLDELKTQGTQMEGIIAQKNNEVENLKKQINAILSKQNVSNNELMLANKLIAELNAKLNQYATQTQQIQAAYDEAKAENTKLVSEKSEVENQHENKLENIANEKKSLEEKIESGSVLVASGYKIQAYNKKKKFLLAGKDVNKETSKAKKADILNITFDIDANRVSESGIKNIHIVLIQPDGNLAIVNGSRNQTFRMANGDLKPYSGLKAISFKTGERVSDVSIEWESNDSFQKGNYQIELYEKGYLIGNSTLTLK